MEEFPMSGEFENKLMWHLSISLSFKSTSIPEL